MSDDVWTFVVAVFSLGGCVGALFSPLLCSLYSRSRCLLCASLGYGIGAIFMSSASSSVAFIIGRFSVGCAAGLASAVVPAYISECAPLRAKGLLACFHSAFICLGITLSSAISIPLNGQPHWRYLLGLTAVPAFLYCLSSFFLVESPKELLSRNEREKAHKALCRLRARPECSEELSIMENNVECSSMGLKAILQDKVYRKALLIALSLQFAQQASGINAILQFSATIFKNLTESPTTANWLGVSVTGVNLIVALGGAAAVDFCGRRKILLGSIGGMAICHLLATLFAKTLHNPNISIVFLILAVATYAAGLGSMFISFALCVPFF